MTPNFGFGQSDMFDSGQKETLGKECILAGGPRLGCFHPRLSGNLRVQGPPPLFRTGHHILNKVGTSALKLLSSWLVNSQLSGYLNLQNLPT